jgi:hypothetical protein
VRDYLFDHPADLVDAAVEFPFGQSRSSPPAGFLNGVIISSRLLVALLDRVHQMPPQLIAPLVAKEAARIGGRDVCILLQDFGQRMLRPLPGRGLVTGKSEPIDGSAAGQAFLRMSVVEERRDDGVRIYLPLMTGSDEMGVLALALDTADEDDRRRLRRLAVLAGGMLAAKISACPPLPRVCAILDEGMGCGPLICTSFGTLSVWLILRWSRSTRCQR